jgi:transcription elongation GreA/GreB family factor
VGAALVGKKRGDKVKVQTPGGQIEMSITLVA